MKFQSSLPVKEFSTLFGDDSTASSMAQADR